MFLILFDMIKIWIFSITEQFFELEDKLSPVIQHGFLIPKENIILINIEHPKMYGKMCAL